MSNIEKRLQNTEKALIALWSLIEDTMPPDYAESTNNMMREYFDANTALGSDFNNRADGYFAHGDEFD